ncbi:LytTR family DNA-binding domain-containing protein [Spirosoma validum]|uniref:LytTR family transcriptional regulator n=1 Tax=Spirosoma validum TaxID=2771355 RepID=A0A927GFY1_9BACT|nr:LytTR family DNA-binding domain-containing protein [Spirosoma validum]MBD2756128.1 LytTR family transcriptional regulator [Spirosoma validum]
MAPLTHRQNVILRLIVVPIAALVASHIVFRQVFPGQPGYQFPWAYFLTVATVMLSCWEVNLFIFRWLDDLLPFWQHPIRRLMSQVLVGGMATLLTFALVFPLSQRLYTHHWPAPTTVLKGVAVCVTLASLVNGGYSGLYLLKAFLAERQKSSYSAEAEQLTKPINGSKPISTAALITIDISNGQLRLPIEQIAYFYSAGGLVLLVKTDGQQVTTRYSSFAQLTSGLDTRYFFQLSRQFVVGLGSVRGVQDDVNRKLVVTLVPALHKQQAHQEVTVSRYRSLELRKWLQVSAER